jgi:hypothetical protein
MRKRVPAQQGQLEKQHAGRPNRWTPAKPGQNALRHNQFKLKQQKRPDKCPEAKQTRSTAAQGRFVALRLSHLR